MCHLEQSNKKCVAVDGAEGGQSGRRRTAAYVAKRRMERSDRRCPWFRRREGSKMEIMVDKEGDDIASEWEDVACQE